jgi:hypothetical protein
MGNVGGTSVRRKRMILGVAAILAVIVLVGSSLPWNRIALGTRPAPHSSAAGIEHAELTHIAVHLAGYAALSCIAWFVAGAAAPGTKAKIVGFGFVLALGYGTEYLQHFVYRHGIEWDDVTTDFAATVVAFAVLGTRAKRAWFQARRPKI